MRWPFCETRPVFSTELIHSISELLPRPWAFFINRLQLAPFNQAPEVRGRDRACLFLALSGPQARSVHTSALCHKQTSSSHASLRNKGKPDLGTGRAFLDGSTELGTLADNLKASPRSYRSTEDWNYEPIDDVSLSVGPKCCAGDSWSRSSTTTLS